MSKNRPTYTSINRLLTSLTIVNGDLVDKITRNLQANSKAIQVVPTRKGDLKGCYRIEDGDSLALARAYIELGLKKVPIQIMEPHISYVSNIHLHNIIDVEKWYRPLISSVWVW